MKTEKLNYHLPMDLIAQEPLPIRSESRLLVLDRQTGRLIDSKFNQIGHFLHPSDCLVLNDTKVLPARFFAQRATGGKLEGLFLSQSEPGVWEVMLKNASRIKIHETLFIKDKTKIDFCSAEVLEKAQAGKCRLQFDVEVDAETILEKIGFPPLPPYIKRDDDLAVAEADRLYYQTVYAQKSGAVAAPTAGLHFTTELIEQLKQQGILFAHVTLHVGTGTFKPISADSIEEHKIHEEWFSIDKDNVKLINRTKDKGGRIIAVGTTTTRVLETVAIGSKVKAFTGSTELFIKPGYKFKVTDAMITNFHLPKSTLLALVAAFAGLDRILAAYRHAIEHHYRFYSYGDAMLIL
jgi:S-adenosylmethionine:tRNA ribosyltransferase-isomerase